MLNDQTDIFKVHFMDVFKTGTYFHIACQKSRYTFPSIASVSLNANKYYKFHYFFAIFIIEKWNFLLLIFITWCIYFILIYVLIFLIGLLNF